jgi:hypothetical protein
MPAKRQRRPFAVGDRVRDKTTGRTGRIAEVDDAAEGQEQCSVAYDEAPQDRYITTPVTEAARRPKGVLEPEPRRR